MRDKEFENWLIKIFKTRDGGKLEKRPISDALSRCRRVEKHEGDLDQKYRKDGMENLISKLTYSKNEEYAGLNPKHSIPIKGDIYNGTSSLKNAAKLYQQFCEYYIKNQHRKR